MLIRRLSNEISKNWFCSFWCSLFLFAAWWESGSQKLPESRKKDWRVTHKNYRQWWNFYKMKCSWFSRRGNRKPNWWSLCLKDSKEPYWKSSLLCINACTSLGVLVRGAYRKRSSQGVHSDGKNEQKEKQLKGRSGWSGTANHIEFNTI